MEVILDKLDELEFKKYGGVIIFKEGVTPDVNKNGYSTFDPNDVVDAYIGDHHYSVRYSKTFGISFDYINPLEPIAERDPYDMLNVNNTLIDRDDERWPKFKKQRLERGFDDSELWSLYMTFAKYIYPRLKAFKEDNFCWPGVDDKIKCAEDWQKILDTMIEAFEDIIYKNDLDWDNKKIDEGLKLFSEYFFDLWT